MTALRLHHSPKIVAPKCARAPFRSQPDERQPDENPRTVSSVQLRAYADASLERDEQHEPDEARDEAPDEEGLDHEIPSETIGVLDEDDFEEVYEGGEFAPDGLDAPPANVGEYADYAADPPHMDGADAYDVEVDIRAFEDAEAELPTCRTPLRTIRPHAQPPSQPQPAAQPRLALEPTPVPPPAILRRSPSIPPPAPMVRPPSIPPVAAALPLTTLSSTSLPALPMPGRLPPPPQREGASLPSFDDPPVPYTPAAVPRDPATARYVVIAGCRTGELVLRALEPGEPPPYGTPIATLTPSCALDARTITMLLNRS